MMKEEKEKSKLPLVALPAAAAAEK